MKLYLSSYQFGNRTDILKKWLEATEKRVGYIPNALDFSSANPERVMKLQTEAFEGLESLRFKPELLDLKNYFGKAEELSEKLSELDLLWMIRMISLMKTAPKPSGKGWG